MGSRELDRSGWVHHVYDGFRDATDVDPDEADEPEHRRDGKLALYQITEAFNRTHIDFVVL